MGGSHETSHSSQSLLGRVYCSCSDHAQARSNFWLAEHFQAISTALRTLLLSFFWTSIRSRDLNCCCQLRDSWCLSEFWLRCTRLLLPWSWSAGKCFWHIRCCYSGWLLRVDYLLDSLWSYSILRYIRDYQLLSSRIAILQPHGPTCTVLKIPVKWFPNPFCFIMSLNGADFSCHINVTGWSVASVYLWFSKGVNVW